MNRKVLYYIFFMGLALFAYANLVYAEGDIKLPTPNMKGGKAAFGSIEGKKDR